MGPVEREEEGEKERRSRGGRKERSSGRKQEGGKGKEVVVKERAREENIEVLRKREYGRRTE